MSKETRQNKTAARASDAPLQFGVKNAIFAAGGFAALVGGYALLAQGSITLAPLLLVLAYVVLLPLAILG